MSSSGEYILMSFKFIKGVIMTDSFSSSLAQQALEAHQYIFSRLCLKGQIKGDHYLALNPNRTDHGLGSFKINLTSGVWADFAIENASGSNIVSFCAYVKQVSYLDAFKWVKDQMKSYSGQSQTRVQTFQNQEADTPLEVKAEPVPLHSLNSFQISPVPENAPGIQEKLRQFGATLYAYKNLEGKLLFYIARVETSRGKNFYPCTLWQNSDGSMEWKFKGYEGLRPFYNLDKLYLNPEAPVLIVEGEKAALAAETLFPKHVVITTSNGAKSPGKTDFSSIKGREISIWPDFDEPGETYATNVISLLEKLNHDKTILVLNVNQAYDHLKVKYPIINQHISVGWDLADAVSENWTAEFIANIPGEFWEVKYEPKESQSQFVFGQYFVRSTGVYHEYINRDGKEVSFLISSRVLPLASTCDFHGNNWGKLLEITNPTDVKVHWIMPKSLLSSNGEPVREAVLYYGASIYNNPSFTEFLMSAVPKKHFISSESTGWHGDSFVLPDKTYGKTSSEIVFNKEFKSKYPFNISGTISDWKNSVGRLCSGNSRLILAVCASLTGPFLSLLGEENGGIHFRGASSTGKTKTLKVAASVWGGEDMIKVWRTTDNAIESTAINHNDAVLLLDELGQVGPTIAGEIAYCLGNGQQKARSSRTGAVRSIKTWRLLFLSTGEVSLVDHISSAGGIARAGMEVRMLDIPADAGAGMGIFENIHEFSSPAEFADAIEAESLRNYGSAADALLEKLTESRESKMQAIDFVKAQQARFVADCIQMSSHGQLQRVAGRLGMIAGVGEHCIQLGILPWATNQAFDACMLCFKAWLESRGGNAATEEIRALQQIRLYIEQHGESRFSSISDPALQLSSIQSFRTHNRVGYFRDNDHGEREYIVTPEAYKSVLCNGFDSRLVTKALRQGSHLRLGSDGSSQFQMRLPGNANSTKVYIIKSSILEDRNS
jgi:putative DNA primase/helicase